MVVNDNLNDFCLFPKQNQVSALRLPGPDNAVQILAVSLKILST
jgi:hypothetical protein